MACVKGASRSASVVFAPDAPYLAAGTMAGAVDLSFSSSAHLEIFELDFLSDDRDLPTVGKCPSSERFNRLSWGKNASASASEEFSLGLVAGGHVDGSISIWNPAALIRSKDTDCALIQHLNKHSGPVRGLEFNNNSPKLLLASGAHEGELSIWDLTNPSDPSHYPPLKVGCILWDMRNTMSPLKEFVGHTKGVIAMSWCPNDSSFLLTCAKDNRSICWDIHSGEIVCELPAGTNWNFDIHWYPKSPGVVSACSFDGKIGIYNLEGCGRLTSGEDEFTGDLIHASSSVHSRAPEWLKRPKGLSFGFGGKLVSFHQCSSSTGASRTSEVYMHTLASELSQLYSSTQLEDAIQKGERASLLVLCDRKSQEAKSEDERETWGFLKVMFESEGTARTKIPIHLGFSVPEGNETLRGEADKEDSNLTYSDKGISKTGLAEGGDGSQYPFDDGEDFFNNLATPRADSSFPRVVDDLVVEDNQEQAEQELLEDEQISALDEAIEHALVVGDYKGAVSQCISGERIADALLIARLGGTTLWESIQSQYLKRSHSSYLKGYCRITRWLHRIPHIVEVSTFQVISAMVNNDLMSLIKARPLHSWKKMLALICTFAEKEEWALLCNTLASRLMAVGDTLAATLCYMCASNIDKTVEIWSCNLKYEHEGRTFVDLFQGLMEKTIILALATGQKQFSASLLKLVEKYVELLADQGLLKTAMVYVKLLGPEEPSHGLALLQDRIAKCQFKVPFAALEVWFVPSSLENTQLQQHPSNPNSPYGGSYQQNPFSNVYGTDHGGYQSIQPKQQFQGYPASFPQLFVPTQSPQVPQANLAPSPVTAEPMVRSFVPSTLPILKNVEQYEQSTLGSQLYPGVSNAYQSMPPGYASSNTHLPHEGSVSCDKLPQFVAPTPSHSFMPVSNPGFFPGPGGGSLQPPGSTQPAQPEALVQPPAPPPMVQTVDTLSVPAELRPIVATLTRLYNESSEALGGSHANPAKKREIEDNSKKIGSLFAKLNSGDISSNAATKLTQLCQALDAEDYGNAAQIQVHLTTSDWDECNFWLVALKRMIRIRQNTR
ncbi:hypothetical protein ACLOJK_024666 [Asimina triloba]